MAEDQDTTTSEEVEFTTETDDESTEETESEQDTATDDSTSTGEDEWTPPTREEWEKHQKDLKKANDSLSKVNKESTQRRLKIRELEKANEDDAAKAQREALEAAQLRYKPVVAKSALLEAQARTDRVGALIKLLNMDALEFDGNDEVVGLDLEVSRLQEEYPEFFTQPEAEKPAAPVAAPAPKPAPKTVAASRKPPVQEAKNDPANALARALMGK